MNINRTVIVGRVEAIRTEGAPRILLAYGPERERKYDQAVNFVNRVWVRVCAAAWRASGDFLFEGSEVEVVGHLQGMLKSSTAFPEGFHDVELVADRLYVGRAQ